MKKVLYLKTHQGIFIPSIGDLGQTLPTPGKSTKMELYDDKGSVLVFTQDGKKKSVTIKIPYGNIAHMLLEEESKE